MVGMAFRVVVAIDGELELEVLISWGDATWRGVAWHVVVMGFDFGPHESLTFNVYCFVRSNL